MAYSSPEAVAAAHIGQESIDRLQAAGLVVLRAEAYQALLNNVANTSTCSGPNCGKTVYWIKTRNGKAMPLNASGEAHWSDCPDAGQFRSKK